MPYRHASQTIIHSPLLGQPQTSRQALTDSLSCLSRLSIRPHAILEVVRRRGRSWGLLAQYEESRLGRQR